MKNSFHRGRAFPILILLLIFCPAEVSAQESVSSILIRNVTVVDPAAGRLHAGLDVVIEGERISSVTPTGEDKAPKGATRVDGGNRFLIPGLWDMHVHLTDATEIALPALVAYGVTGVRDMGGDLELIDRWREEISAEERIGPRILRPGPYIDGEKPGAPFRLTVETAADGRAAVAALAAHGVDHIKVHNWTPREAYIAVIEEAKRRDLLVTGHVPITIGADEAVEAGHGCFEHMTPFFEGVSLERLTGTRSLITGVKRFRADGAAEFISRMVEKGAWVDPTLIAGHVGAHWSETSAHPPPEAAFVAASLKEQWDRFFSPRSIVIEAGRRRLNAELMELLGMMHEAGVGVLAGTDLALRDVFPGASLHDELGLLARAGLTPAEALAAATSEPARFLGLTGEMGSIAPGQAADLVLLAADPLSDIANTRKIEAVVVRGRLLLTAERESMLEDVRRRAPEM